MVVAACLWLLWFHNQHRISRLHPVLYTGLGTLSKVKSIAWGLLTQEPKSCIGKFTRPTLLVQVRCV